LTEVHRVAPDLSEIRRMHALLAERWAQRQLPAELETPVTLALEEVLSNVIRHNGPAGPDIVVRFRFAPDAFEFEVSDSGAEFNPLALPPFDPSAGLEQRRAGGMGVHIVRELADELRYEYRDGRNCLIFRKRL
jgi:serine/threonine-protein kinase RsbW